MTKQIYFFGPLTQLSSKLIIIMGSPVANIVEILPAKV